MNWQMQVLQRDTFFLRPIGRLAAGLLVAAAVSVVHGDVHPHPAVGCDYVVHAHFGGERDQGSGAPSVVAWGRVADAASEGLGAHGYLTLGTALPAGSGAGDVAGTRTLFIADGGAAPVPVEADLILQACNASHTP